MKIVKNFLSLAGAETISKVLTFAAFAYLARIAGPVSFGYVEWAGAALLCTGLIVDQGFGPFGAREIAKTPERTADLTAQIVGARFMLAIVAYAIIVALAFIPNHAPVLTQLLLIYGLSLFAAPLLLTWVFQGHDRMQTVALVQVIRQTIFAVIVLAFVRNSFDLWIVAVAEVLALTVAASFSVLIFNRKLKVPFRISFKISGAIFREGVPIGLSQIFWVVKMFGATLIVGLVATAEDVGYFAAAMRILIALHTFVWLYYFNLLPSLSRAWEKGNDEFAKLIKRSMRIVLWVSAAVGLGWIIVAPIGITGVYGTQFAPAGPPLQLMAGACIVAAVSGHYRYGLIAAGHQKSEMMTSAFGAVLAVLAIPFGYIKGGVSGAAASLFIAEAGVWICSWIISKRLLKLNGHSKLLLRPVCVGAIAACPLLLPIESFLIKLLAAMSVFIVGAIISEPYIRRQILLLLSKRGENAKPCVEQTIPNATR